MKEGTPDLNRPIRLVFWSLTAPDFGGFRHRRERERELRFLFHPFCLFAPHCFLEFLTWPRTYFWAICDDVSIRIGNLVHSIVMEAPAEHGAAASRRSKDISDCSQDIS